MSKEEGNQVNKLWSFVLLCFLYMDEDNPMIAMKQWYKWTVKILK